jgi:acyl-coenzyme A thioesterase PaaI-like protein
VELADRVRQAVASQPFMEALGVGVARVAVGEVDLELRFDERLTLAIRPR